jgi:hypothetical protein
LEDPGGRGRGESWRLLYLYLSAAYAALAAYTLWSPFWLWAARYAYANALPAAAYLFQVAPYATAAAAFVAVLGYAPGLALALAAFGAAAGSVAGAGLLLPIVLAAGSSLLYSLATRPPGGHTPRRSLAAAAALEATALAAAAYTGTALGPLLAAAAANPPSPPGLAGRALRALASTTAGRLTLYGLAAALTAAAARRLEAAIAALAAPRLAARRQLAEAGRRLRQPLGAVAEGLS